MQDDVLFISRIAFFSMSAVMIRFSFLFPV